MKQWLKPMLEKTLQHSLQWVVDRDVSAHSLSQLEGHVIVLRLRQSPWPIQFILGQPVQVFLEDTEQADVSVELSLLHLQQLQQGHAMTSLIKSGDLIIEGQLHILQQFVIWIQQVDIDFFEPLSRVIGDYATYHIQRLSRQSKQRAQGFAQIKKQQFAEYIQYEAQLTLTHAQYNGFKKDQKQLEQDIGQLEHRLQKLREAVS